jgi:AcrR family transcriptional regulator
MTIPDNAVRKPGRPRSAQSHQAILEATVELLAETGYEAMSIEAVAARAGVGKTTIYRRWASKEELVSEAIRTLHSELAFVDTGNIRDDLITFLKSTFQARPSIVENLLLKMLSEMRTNPEIYSTFHASIIAPRLQELTQFVQRAQARGEIRPDLDPLFVIDLIAGPALYRLLLSGIMTSPPPPDLPEQIVDAVLHGIAAEPSHKESSTGKS